MTKSPLLVLGVLVCSISLVSPTSIVNSTKDINSNATHKHTNEQMMMKMYHPLTCNANLHNSNIPCNPWSSQQYNPQSSPIVIPCGSCVTMDLTGTLDLPFGLDIQGKLYFPTGSSINITTPFVYVQGELVIDPPDDTHVPSPHGFGVGFYLSDTNDDLAFVPHADNCEAAHGDGDVDGGGAGGEGCNVTVNRKPIVVAGGRLDIRGLPESCPSWRRLAKVVRDGVVIPEDDVVPVAPEPPSSSSLECSSSLVDDDFSSSSEGHTIFQNNLQPQQHYSFSSSHNNNNNNWEWDGFTADGFIDTELIQPSGNDNGPPTLNSYYSVHNRTAHHDGPRVSLPIPCITPNEPYIIHYLYRVIPTDGNPTLAQSLGGSYIPFLGVVRTPTDLDSHPEWSFPNYLHAKGSVGTVTDSEWHTMQYTIQFSDDQASTVLTSTLHLYLSMYDADAIIDIDDVSIRLAPATVFPSKEEICTDLLLNGDAAIGHKYPFYAANGGHLYTVSPNDDSDDDSTPYFRMTERVSEWSKTLSHDLFPPCLIVGSVYRFHAYYRVHSDTPISAEVSIWTQRADDGAMGYHTVTYCPPSSRNSNSGGGDDTNWVECTALYTFTEEYTHADAVWFHTRLPGDSTSDIDWKNVTFQFQPTRTGVKKLLLLDHHDEPDNDATTLTPTPVGDCWSAGAELLITSHTLHYSDSQLGLLEGIDPDDGGLILRESIVAPLSMEDGDGFMAVEVALLSRNVVFSTVKVEEEYLLPIVGDGDDVGTTTTTIFDEDGDVDDSLIGGHLIVLHTPNVAQIVMGVEIEGFGQQGSLGRYPIHFHMCNAVHNSILKRNLIRNSHQRCIVLHNTHHVQLIENVAYNTAGHCFLLEDGGEHDNSFHRNLGAMTRAVQHRISMLESDNVPATFWITNPVNTFVGNVAAGSMGSGFWFELGNAVRGASAPFYPGVRPKELPLQLFRDNTSHSNIGNGVQTYPQLGYEPPQPGLAILRNHKSYRNYGAGVFIHAGGRLEIDGGYFSDNKVGVWIDRDHSDGVRNMVIVGVSAVYRAVTDDLGYEQSNKWPQRIHCYGSSDDDGVIGIRIDAYFWGGTRATGTQIQNITFLGFEPTPTCPDSTILGVNDRGRGAFFDPRNSITDLTVEDYSSAINLCRAEQSGLVQVAIWDKDGSLVGGGNGDGGGFIVSNVAAMTMDDRCVGLGNGTCAAFCAGVCLRVLRVAVPAFYSNTAPAIFQLEVDGTDERGHPISTVIVTNHEKPRTIADLSYWESYTSLFVALPAGGSYTAKFTLDGVVIWPTFADTSYEDEPNGCGPDFASFEIDKLDPLCDELIVNGNAGDDIVGGSTVPWQVFAGGIEAVEGGADGTAYSLMNGNSRGKWYGLVQHLDTRCVVEGQRYVLNVKVRLTTHDDGNLWVCNVGGSSSDPASCASATMRYSYGITDATHEYDPAGVMIESENEWNTLTGEFTVSAFAAGASRVILYINGVPDGINIQIDSVSILPFRTTHVPTPPTPVVPTRSPTNKPIQELTPMPTGSPTEAPSMHPTRYTTQAPTRSPTNKPIQVLTPMPTGSPTEAPSMHPTRYTTLAPTIRCKKNQVRFTLELQTDNRGNDTSWFLKMQKNDGMYKKLTGGKRYTNNKMFTKEICIKKRKCYEFRIKDKTKDGLCCSNGEGYYKITKDGKLLRHSIYNNTKMSERFIFGVGKKNCSK